MKSQTIEITLDSFECLRRATVAANELLEPNLTEAERVEKVRELRTEICKVRRTCPDLLPAQNVIPFPQQRQRELFPVA